MTKNTHDEHTLEAGTMQQVRDLLFGAQIKEMEGRFQRQEERFSRDFGDLRATLSNRLDSFENFSRRESESILQRLQQEQEERGSALEAEQRERAAAIRAEYERIEVLQNEQNTQSDTLERLARELAAAQESIERKFALLSSALDSTEQILRQLQLTESDALAGKIEEKHQEALRVLAETTLQIRQSTVPRSALAMFFSDMAFKVGEQADVQVGGRSGGQNEESGFTGDALNG